MPLMIFWSKLEEKMAITEVNREERRYRAKDKTRERLKSEGQETERRKRSIINAN
jgi:hypothetical protein